ncbi:MAG: DUF45 domain-containing protein [Dehalococcoidales bacterium]|nr:DUF45 domain-containing protein [Dehalococcoidales bacterium]
MDIDAEFEPLTVYNYEVSANMDKLVRHVLKVIPNRYAEEFPSFSVFEAKSPWGAHIERESIEDEGKIYFDPRLLKMAKKVAIGTIAHEFAHLFLGHTGPGSLQGEYEADDLARQWGFKNEIEAMRKHSGPPTEGHKRI